MTIEELKNKKIQLGLTNERVSELAEIPLSTVQKIFAGATTRPREATLLKLENALLKADSERTVNSYEVQGTGVPGLVVRRTGVPERYEGFRFEDDIRTVSDKDESAWVLPHGEHTIAEYFALPPGSRIELIDGEFYDMAPQERAHQILILMVATMLMAYETDNHTGYTPYVAPVDVRLDRDYFTMVQPDIAVVCKDNPGRLMAEEELGRKLAGRIVNGAPDLVIEVVSPVNRNHDLQRKFFKYIRSGVKECWMIDFEKEYILVQGQDPELANLYTFNDTVPVGITGGDLEIDFSKIRERLKELL